MIRRKVSVVLAFSGLLTSVGLLGCASAEEPRRLPSVTRFWSEEPLPSAAQQPPSAVQQTSYLLQPEYPENSDAFGSPVPVETLVQYALANTPEIQAARYRARAMGARVPQAASPADPQLMTTTFLNAIQTAAGPQEVAMSLSQRFPWFGKLALRSQVAYHDAMAAYAQLAAVELSVVERVKRAYYDIYFLQHAIAVTRSLEPRLEEVIEITRDKYRTNKVGLESVLQAQIELSSLKTSLVEQEQAKAEAVARLAGLLHLPPDAAIRAEETLDRTKVAHTARLLVELAESCQPELTARRREIRRDRTSTELACREYWPDVTASVNWFAIGSPGLSPVATGDDAYSLGVGVNLPLYRSRLDAAVREAQYNTLRSTRQYEATRDKVRAEVQALYAQFVQHEKVLEILESQIVPQAGQSLDLSIEAFRVDRLEFQQLIDSYKMLLKYQVDKYRRESLRQQAIASLERAVGSALTGGPFVAEADVRGLDDASTPLPPE